MSKTSIFLFLFLFTTYCSLRAQYYVQVSTGYSIAAASELNYQRIIRIDDLSISRQNEYSSFGQGFDFKAAFGTFMTPGFGLELGINYHLSDKKTYEDHFSNAVSQSQYITSHYWGITPAVVLRIESQPLSMYAKAGIVFAFPNLVVDAYQVPIWGNSSNFPRYTNTYSGNIAVGYSGTFGVELAANGLCYFVEAGFTGLSWQPAALTETDGTYSIKFTLKDSISPTDPNTASIAPRPTPFSAVGVTLGVKVNL